jgi:hypothetical protein
MTPTYGLIKQLQYRNMITGLLLSTFKDENDLRLISLAGAHCFDNPNSIENQLMDKKHCAIIIAEKDKASYNKLASSLGFKQVRLRPAGSLKGFNACEGKYKNGYVIILNTTLINAYRMLKELKQTVHAVIADYYANFNPRVEAETAYLIENNLISRKGYLFLTYSNPTVSAYRESNKRLVKYDPRQLSYATGVYNYVRIMIRKQRRILFNYRLTYKNKPVGIDMHVAMIQVN